MCHCEGGVSRKGMVDFMSRIIGPGGDVFVEYAALTVSIRTSFDRDNLEIPDELPTGSYNTSCFLYNTKLSFHKSRPASLHPLYFPASSSPAGVDLSRTVDGCPSWALVVPAVHIRTLPLHGLLHASFEITYVTATPVMATRMGVAGKTFSCEGRHLSVCNE